MKTYHVQADQIIHSSAKIAYSIISDYEQGHLAILPKEYFTGMIVEKGGQGAGTVALVHMNVMGAKRSFRLETIEPEPGHIFDEVNLDDGAVTRFIVEPLDDETCKVTIASDFPVLPGLSGLMERLINPPIIRKIYKKELQNLDAYAAKI